MIFCYFNTHFVTKVLQIREKTQKTKIFYRFLIIMGISAWHRCSPPGLTCHVFAAKRERIGREKSQKAETASPVAKFTRSLVLWCSKDSITTSENIVVYPPSTLRLHSGGYTPYFRYLPSQKDTQSFCSVAYLLSIAKEEKAHGRES